MIVYVETNFILELALEQDQHNAANRILELAEDGKVEISFPGFSISESLTTVTRRRRERKQFSRLLQQTLDQLKLSEPYKQIANDLDPAQALLQNAIETESDRLLSVIERILLVGKILELDTSSFRQALTYKGQLSTEDSTIYGTIISDLRLRQYDETKFFLSKDEEAFDDDRKKKRKAYEQRIKTELASYNCKYIKVFEHGLSAIESKLRRSE